MPEDSPVFEWYKVSLNLVFYSCIYIFIHIFPLSCIYYELENEDGQDAGLNDSVQEDAFIIEQKKKQAEYTISTLSKHLYNSTATDINNQQQ